MPGPPIDLITDLKAACSLRRAVETGTYLGGGSRELARVFEEVVTVELSRELAARAQEWLPEVPNVKLLQQDSRDALRALANPEVPTLYFLDGHWSGGPTAGEESECPVMAEVDALVSGGEEDCVIIDDARLFACPPPPPHDPSQWPTLIELFDELRRLGDARHVTLVSDYVISVPHRAKGIVDVWGATLLASPSAQPAPGLAVTEATRPGRLRRWMRGA